MLQDMWSLERCVTGGGRPAERKRSAVIIDGPSWQEKQEGKKKKKSFQGDTENNTLQLQPTAACCTQVQLLRRGTVRTKGAIPMGNDSGAEKAFSFAALMLGRKAKQSKKSATQGSACLEALEQWVGGWVLAEELPHHQAGESLPRH